MPLTDAQYRNLVESIDDCAICHLDLEGIVHAWNAGAERIVGYPAAAMVGQPIARLFTEADRAGGMPARELATARETGRFEDAGWRVRADGTQVWARTVITPIRDDSGALVGFAQVLRDLTDHSFRQFVEATNGILWTTDATGQPNADSPSFRAFTGQTKEEWLSRLGWAPVHPDDVNGMLVAWRGAKADRKPFSAELKLRRHDGVYVWHTARAIPFFYPDGSVREWFGVTFDISARKEAEEARIRAESWWSTTLRSIGDGVIATDAHGRIQFVNAVAERLTGWTFADARDKPLADVFRIIDEDSRAPVDDPVARVLASGNIIGLANHTLLVRRDGTEVAIDDSAAPIRNPAGTLDGVVLVFRDASSEKLEAARRTFLARAGDELGQAADYRQALALVARLAVPRLADWCIVDLVELDADETRGPAPIRRHAIEHVDPERAAFARRHTAAHPVVSDAKGSPGVIRSGVARLIAEVPISVLAAHAVDDEHRRAIEDIRSLMIVPLHGRTRILGALTFIYTGSRRYTGDDLAFAEELARRVAIVVERRRLEEEALAASRAKDEFLALLGHELRNPLAPILTAVQLSKQRGATAMHQEVIERQVAHLVRLVDDLLDVSRITRGKVELATEPLALAGVIAQALETASPLIDQRGHRVTVDVPDTLVTRADPYRLAQVFANLVNNAAKYTPAGGEIAIAGTREGDEIVVAVRDTGVGISPEVLPQVFELFVQEKQGIDRAHGGLGIGLAIVKNLVGMHGGSVTAESAGPGKGSTFRVRLPRSDEAIPSASTSASTNTDTEIASRHRILIVDDNADGAMMMKAMLEGLGYEICVAHDGPQALAVAPAFRPDVALLDIGLPGMDGYELAGRLHALLAAAPPRLVAVTGYGRDQDRAQARNAGFDRHLGKPVTIGLLQKTLGELLGQ